MTFYVYAHARKTDGSVFYIGKGSGDRAYKKQGRNKMWNSVFEKHGCNVAILSRWANESDAYDEEERLIREIGIEHLANMSLGGRGAKGVEFSRDRKEKARKHLDNYNKNWKDFISVAQGKSKKRIFTKCGRSFLGAAAVREWMTSGLGIKDCNQQLINRAAQAGREYKGVHLRYRENFFVEKPALGHRSMPVGNSDGEIFPSIRKAVEAMEKKGIKTTSPSIHGAINGRSVTAGGKRWGYVVDGAVEIKDFERKTKNKKIKRSDGKIYPSLKCAAMETVGMASGSKNISLCALGKTKSAYGYQWEYI